jgi:hypothetical protein
MCYGFKFNKVLLIRSFLAVTMSRPALGPTQPLDQQVPGLKRTEREANHLLLSSVEVKNMWGYTSTPPYVYMV